MKYHRRPPYFVFADKTVEYQGKDNKTEPGLWMIPGVGIMAVAEDGTTVVIDAWAAGVVRIGDESDTRPWCNQRKLKLMPGGLRKPYVKVTRPTE